jgi:hypothetical protein
VSIDRRVEFGLRDDCAHGADRVGTLGGHEGDVSSISRVTDSPTEKTLHLTLRPLTVIWRRFRPG